MNAKRVYRVMRLHDLLHHRIPARPGIERRHDGTVALARSNRGWCSDGFEFRGDNGEPLREVCARLLRPRSDELGSDDRRS